MNFKETKNVIHAKLKDIRESKELSQDDLAARLQVLDIQIDQQGISKIENNKRKVSDYELAGICKALRIPVSSLLDDFMAQLSD